MFNVFNMIKSNNEVLSSDNKRFLKQFFLQDQKEFDKITASLILKVSEEEMKELKLIAENNYQNYFWLSDIYKEDYVSLFIKCRKFEEKINNLGDIDRVVYDVLQTEYANILISFLTFDNFYMSFLDKNRRLVSIEKLKEEYKAKIVPQFYEPIKSNFQLCNSLSDILMYSLESELSYIEYMTLKKEFLQLYISKNSTKYLQKP